MDETKQDPVDESPPRVLEKQLQKKDALESQKLEFLKILGNGLITLATLFHQDSIERLLLIPSLVHINMVSVAEDFFHALTSQSGPGGEAAEHGREKARAEYLSGHICEEFYSCGSHHERCKLASWLSMIASPDKKKENKNGFVLEFTNDFFAESSLVLDFVKHLTAMCEQRNARGKFKGNVRFLVRTRVPRHMEKAVKTGNHVLCDRHGIKQKNGKHVVLANGILLKVFRDSTIEIFRSKEKLARFTIPVKLEADKLGGGWLKINSKLSREEEMQRNLKEAREMYEREKGERERAEAERDIEKVERKKAEAEREREKAEREEAEERHMCVICMERAVNLAFGCGHQLCEECGVQMKECPVCRKHIESRLRLFKT